MTIRTPGRVPMSSVGSGRAAGRRRVGVALVVAAVWAVAAVRDVRGFWPDLLLGSVPFALALAALVGMLLSVRRPWRRPAVLAAPDGTRLRAEPGSGFSWFVAAEILILTVAAIPQVEPLMDRATAPAGPDRYVLTALPLVLALLAALLVVVLVAAVRDGRPRVDLTPAGVEVRQPFGRQFVPWAALSPGTPLRQSSGSELVLDVCRPETVRRSGLPWGTRRRPRLLLSWLWVHPWYLADVLRFYVDHPHERDGIGADAGRERLRGALAAG
ncbi:PH domain-containing protein [Micromonospora sp. CPCC 205711]|uniref:PH domain-containing protein n=1 Tax=Micromonospora sp. CPCC 205547 TaxID=3122400 RepID=UPI002FEFA975